MGKPEWKNEKELQKGKKKNHIFCYVIVLFLKNIFMVLIFRGRVFEEKLLSCLRLRIFLPPTFANDIKVTRLWVGNM